MSRDASSVIARVKRTLFKNRFFLFFICTFFIDKLTEKKAPKRQPKAYREEYTRGAKRQEQKEGGYKNSSALV